MTSIFTKSSMRQTRLSLTAGVAAMMLFSAAIPFTPLHAQENDAVVQMVQYHRGGGGWHGGGGGWHGGGGGWRGGGWGGWGGYYAAPPVIYGAPYYNPPPVIYGPGITIW